MKHVCIDLETMGTAPDSAIVAIGAVEFDLDADMVPRIGREFYVNVDLASCVEYGMKIDPNTVYWWLKQSDEARASLTDSEHPKIGLWSALTALIEWWPTKTVGGRGIDREVRVWARGQDFDIGILRIAFDRTGLKHPWAYNVARDTRTLYEALGTTPETTIPPNDGAHNALKDAKWEAKAIIQALVIQARRVYDLGCYEAKAAGRETPADAIIEHLVGEHGRGPLPIKVGCSPLQCRCTAGDEAAPGNHHPDCPVEFINPQDIGG